MEVTGRFELPEELLDLERSGINEATAFERSRARRAISQAPSPPFGNANDASAWNMYGFDSESSRSVHQGLFCTYSNAYQGWHIRGTAKKVYSC